MGGERWRRRWLSGTWLSFGEEPGRAGDASAGCMMESIRNFLQLRNTPNTRMQERAEESRVPGGKGEEEEGGCRGLEITGGESSEGRGQRVGLTWGFGAFSSSFPGFFWCLSAPHGASCVSGGLGHLGSFMSFPPSFPPSSPWLSVISDSRTQGSHSPLLAPWGRIRAWGAKSSLENRHIPAERCPRSTGALWGDPPCRQRGRRLPQEPRRHLPHTQRVCQGPCDHAPASSWARLG